MHLKFLAESGNDIGSPLDFFHFLSCVGINEIIDVHKAATNSDLDLVALLDLHVDALLSELVDAFGLPQEQDLHLLPLWVGVQETRQLLVNLVIVVTDVDVLFGFLFNAVHQFSHLLLRIFEFLTCLLEFLTCLLEFLTSLLEFLTCLIKFLNCLMELFLDSVKILLLNLQIVVQFLNV